MEERRKIIDELSRIMTEPLASMKSGTYWIRMDCSNKNNALSAFGNSADFLAALKRLARSLSGAPEGGLMTGKPSVTLPGKVEKIIKSVDPSEPDKAQISVDGAEELYQELRIENTLADEKGNEVELKTGDEVKVTVQAEKEATKPKE